MAHNILITGGSGYLGGSLLAHLASPSTNLPPYSTLYALVRTPEQASQVQSLYSATPLTLDLSNPPAVQETIISHNITIIYHLYNPLDTSTHTLIEALAQVQQNTGLQTHFLYTTGAKLFSSHVGAPTSTPLLDTDPTLLEIQSSLLLDHQSTTTGHPLLKQGVRANVSVVSRAAELGVKSYIFAPCIVYGEGKGFGNRISIQTVAVVQAARRVGRVWDPHVGYAGEPTWPVCHVDDNTALYARILERILAGEEVGSGREGWFLASSGSVRWRDLYEAMAVALKKRGVVETEDVLKADDEVLGKMSEAWGCEKDFVEVMLGGLCTFTAEHGKKIGWTPQYPPEHIIEAADAEVELILRNLKDEVSSLGGVRANQQ
ncbi:NAD(P)-binding protein [Corynespora cassiicola Philippines]|uniref:NAD(P)-binding protein n=1 Tax=Corynespora cassiicola Philippines TaxID=1448308 RepID=A0A2T2P2S2_CORCC|nr:NAD(P)-binding protein [Corynespora cassiicola Philippines]